MATEAITGESVAEGRAFRALVLVTDAYGGYGGIAQFNQNFHSALCSDPRCHEVVSLPRFIRGPVGPLPAKLTFKREGVNSKLRYLWQAWKLRRAGSDFGLIVCGHINLVPAAFLARHSRKAPICLVIHGTDAWQPPPSRVARTLVSEIDAFFTVSEFTKQRFMAWSKVRPEKGFLLQNCVDLSKFTPGPPDMNLVRRYGLSSRKVIMTLGRLDADERGKGIDHVLELLPSLVTDVPDLAYLIVGDGADRPRLQTKARDLGVADRTIFAGRVSEEEKAAHYRLADAYVMPGRFEGFGIAYLEALACGVPALGSKLDASREALNEGQWGVLVDPRDSRELRAGILECLGRPRVVPHGLDRFSFEQFQNRVHELVQQVVRQ